MAARRDKLWLGMLDVNELSAAVEIYFYSWEAVARCGRSTVFTTLVEYRKWSRTERPVRDVSALYGLTWAREKAHAMLPGMRLAGTMRLCPA